MKTIGRVCAVEGCEREYLAKGYCKLHWRRWHDHGDPHKILRSATTEMGIAITEGCLVEGCEERHYGKGYCKTHWTRWHNHGDPNVLLLREDGSGCITQHGYIDRGENGKRQYEHIRIAERVLGKPLPAGAQVHHVSNIGTDNRNENLVICQDASYHKLLHKRLNALRACGHADWIKCCYCHKHDHPDNIYSRKRPSDPSRAGSSCHRECKAIYLRDHRSDLRAVG